MIKNVFPTVMGLDATVARERVQASSFGLLVFWSEWTHLCFLEGPEVLSWVWGHRVEILVPGRLRQEDHVFETHLAYFGRLCLKGKKYQQLLLLLSFQKSKVKKQYKGSKCLNSTDEHGWQTETPHSFLSPDSMCLFIPQGDNYAAQILPDLPMHV